jgi:hypothetical protein
VRLHLDAPRVESDEGKGDRAREHLEKLRGKLRRLCADSARDQHVFEELPRPSPGSAIDVTA